MLKLRSLVSVAAGLVAIPLMGSPAWSVACVSGTEASYEAIAGTGCTVGPLTFFGFNFNLISLNGGVIGGLIIDPFQQFGEFGLMVTYSANVASPGAATDLAWSMGVAGPPAILDAFASLTGSATSPGSAVLSEQIFNAFTGQQIGSIQLTAPNTSQTIFFPPTLEIFAVKDQANFTPDGGSAFTSVLINAYSIVPGPIAGAGLPGLLAACGGLLALARRRRRQIA